MPQLKSCVLALSLLLIGASAGTASADDEDAPQYRRVELLDGRVLVVQVLGTDDKGLLVSGRDGSLRVPWMDIINLDEIDEATFLEAVTRRLVYVGTWIQDAKLEGPGGEIARRFEGAVVQAPRVKLIPEQELDAMLSASDEARLAACEPSDSECVAPFIDAPSTQEYLYGVVEPLTGRMRVTFSRVSLETGLKLESVPLAYQPEDPISDPSLYQATWRLLGLDLDTLPDMPAAPPLKPAPADPMAAAPAGDPPGGTEPQTEPDGPAPSPRTAATRGRFVPLPGAPALFAQDPMTFAISAGAVAVVTGAAVYAAGGVGLPVPWTVDQASVGDPLLLTGVGTVTFVVTSLITNQIVAKIGARQPRAARVQVQSVPGGIALRF